MGCVWKRRREQGCEGRIGSRGGDDSGGQGQMAHEAHVDMPGNMARPEPPPVNVTQRPQPGHSNSRIRDKPQVTGPVRPHLCDSTCAQLGDTSCTTRVHCACGRGWLGSQGESQIQKHLGSPGCSPCSCCHTERLPTCIQCCYFLTSQSLSSSGFFMVRDALCQ